MAPKTYTKQFKRIEWWAIPSQSSLRSQCGGRAGLKLRLNTFTEITASEACLQLLLSLSSFCHGATGLEIYELYRQSLRRVLTFTRYVLF